MDHAAHGDMKMDDSAAKMDNMKMTEADYDSNALSDNHLELCDAEIANQTHR
jgi:hypothetical protein